ncbi:MAG: hypothetical protein E7612_08955 [Ruminococcaceae bacterium]|nr:hypothetical protein [Oscillospiraceae bacterium]
MERKAILPAALILDLDDVMWHDGRDLRYIGQASRSEFPRHHVPEDYKIIDQLGRALNMKIICPICLGDWDKDNCLRGVVGVTHNPSGWNRKEEIDYELAEKFFEAAESSPYIDYCIHGLLHGLYDENGVRLNEKEYSRITEDRRVELLPDCELDKHLDLFQHIYDSWGFKKKIISFCPPCGFGFADKDDWGYVDRLSKNLYKRGIRYIIARWQRKIECSKLNSGVWYMEKNVKFGIPSDAPDVDPRYIREFAEEGEEVFGEVMGMHWANFLHYYPQNNLARLGDWIEYFQRQAEVFGIMLSRDIRFTGNQSIYRNNSKISYEDGRCIVDISDALALDFDDLGKEFYISFKNDSLPKSCEGGKMELYESKNNFKTYKITYENKIIKFSF